MSIDRPPGPTRSPARRWSRACPTPFSISDDQPLTIDVAGYDVMLRPGHDALLPVVIDLRSALGEVAFDQLALEGGVRVLDQDDPADRGRPRADRAQAFRPGP